MELADLVLTPGQRAELVMGDRRHHQEAGGGRVQAAIQPIGTLHARSLLMRLGPCGSHRPAGGHGRWARALITANYRVATAVVSCIAASTRPPVVLSLPPASQLSGSETVR